MQEVTIDRAKSNVELLDSELKTQLPGLVYGVSASRGGITIHLDDTATPENITQAQQIVSTHDETAKTSEQQKQEQLKADIETDRALYTDKFNPATITLESLAKRVLWLENELRELRGL